MNKKEIINLITENRQNLITIHFKIKEILENERKIADSLGIKRLRYGK